VFRHIKLVLDKLANLGRDSRFLQRVPPIGVAPLEPRIERLDIPHPFRRPKGPRGDNVPWSRRRAADCVGRAFPGRLARPLPKGFFWKQDAGAPDRDPGRPRAYRIYRKGA
jgi:hypothetical protein